MKVLILFALQFLFFANLHAEAPNLLTYQGRLKEGGQAVSGNRMVNIRLCDAETIGNCHSNGAQSVTVSNGLFRSTFTVPVTALVGTGDWYVEIIVGEATLTPRERLTSSAYSLFAATAAYASNIAAAAGSDGVHITSNVYIVGFSSASKFYGDGSELTNLPASVGAVAASGDTMTGTLTMNAASALTTGNQPELVISTNIYVVGYSSAAMYYGNGSLLTGISATTVADGSVTDAKIVTVSSSKLTGTVSPALIDLSTVTTALAGKLANIETVSPLLIDLSTVTTALGTKLDKGGDLMTGHLTLAGSTLTVISPDSLASSLWVSTSATKPHLYVSTTGKVGVGTALPAYLLDVNGKGNFADNVMITGVDVGEANSNTNALTVYGGGGWYPIASFRTAISVNPLIEVSQPAMNRSMHYGIDKTNGLGYITSWKDFPAGNGMPIWIGPSSGYGGEYTKGLYLTVEGNVGLGETIPQAKLHVVSTSTTDSAVFIASHSTAGYGLFVSTNGNVGVGTAGPAYRLVVSSGAGEAGNLVVISTGASNVIRMTGAGEIHANKFYGSGANLTGVSTHTFSIGDSYGGGKVFWVDAAGRQVLIAPTADQSTGVKWSNNSNTTGANNDGVYAGRANTVIISTMQHAGSYAAQLCADYSVAVNGEYYDDWYLPSKSELSLLYAQKDTVGGFSANWYWTSSEFGPDTALAWYVDLGNGGMNGDTKAAFTRVRCVRAAPSTAIGNLPTNAETVTNGAYLSSTQTFTGDNTFKDVSARTLTGTSANITGDFAGYGLAVSSNVSLADAFYTKNGNVGIGVTAPTAKLQIGGTPGLDGIQFPDGTLMTSAGAGSASNLSNLVDAVINADSDANATGALHLQVGGTDKLTILNGGNVGIGIAAPQAGLNVVSQVQTAGLFEGAGQTELTLQSNGGGTTQFPTYLTFNAYSPSNFGVRAMGYLGFDTSGNMLFTNTDNGFTGGTRMLIAAAGNIGINTDTPQGRLDVKAGGSGQADMAQIWRRSDNVIVGSMSATGVMAATRFVGDGSGLTGVADNLGNHTATTTLQMNTFNILNASTVSAKAMAIGKDVAVGSLVSLLARPLADDYDYVLYVTTGFYSVSPTLVVSSAGYVGMGTNNPRTRLDVMGGGHFASSMTVDGGYYGNGATLTGVSTHTFSIGDSYGGGKVFWVDAAGKQVLIAAASDQSTGIKWSNNSNATGASYNAVYAGKANTVIISTMQHAGSYAAQVCADYSNTAGGEYYDDWYLPSSAELQLLYANKSVIDSPINNYWSSTEYVANTTYALYVDFSNGGVNDYNKVFSNYIRCVRAGPSTAIGNLPTNAETVTNGAYLTSTQTFTGTNSFNEITAARYQIHGSTVVAILQGSGSLGVGVNAGRISTGDFNVFIGSAAGYSTTGTAATSNNFVGYMAGYNNSSGNQNNFMGREAGRTNTTGGNNTFVGNSAGYGNNTGMENSYLGDNAGYSNAAGRQNVALGASAGAAGGSSFSSSTLVGFGAGSDITTGIGNTLLGYKAGDNLITGNSNIIIGNNQDATASTISDELNIGGLLRGNLNAGTIGIGFTNTIPLAALDVKSTGTASDNIYAQIWRDSNGTEVASMTVTGKLFANGSGLTGIVASDSSKLPLTGGMLTGGLTVTGASVTVNASDGELLRLNSNSTYASASFWYNTTTLRGSLGFGNSGGIFVPAINGAMGLVGYAGLHLGATGKAALTVTTDDKIGIGIISPAYALDVSTANDSDVYVFRAGANGIVISTGGAIQTTGVGYGTVAGNARGDGAVDLQAWRDQATQVAGGIYSVIIGGQKNRIDTTATRGTIGGGYGNSISNDQSDGFIGGGFQNTLSGTGQGRTISGGMSNTVAGNVATIAGGWSNAASAEYSIVGGGWGNAASGSKSAVSGGYFNAASAEYSAVGGGNNNAAGGPYTVIAGGNYNTASGQYAAVSGGNENKALNYAATISGGANNRVLGQYSMVPGGYGNDTAGNFSFAAGYLSSSTYDGTFTWSDSQGVILENNVVDRTWFKNRGGFLVSGSTNTANPGFFVAGNGNVGIGTMTPSALLEVRNGALKVIGPNTSLTNTLTIDGANSAQTISEFYSSEANPRLAIGMDLINGYGFGQAGIAFSAAGSAAGLVNAIGTDGNSNLGFFTGGTANANEKMTIMTGGNVGIGVVSPGQALEVNGGIRINTATAQPVCSVTTRGTFWIVQGGAGVKDNVQVCAKDAAEAYAWRVVY